MTRVVSGPSNYASGNICIRIGNWKVERKQCIGTGVVDMPCILSYYWQREMSKLYGSQRTYANKGCNEVMQE